jgi:hypothetical protein
LPVQAVHWVTSELGTKMMRSLPVSAT